MEIVFCFFFVLEVFILFCSFALFYAALKEYREIKELKKKYIKTKKIKSKALCNACEYEHYCADRSNDCRTCEQYAGEKICKCYEIEYGEECPYFKPIESEV